MCVSSMTSLCEYRMKAQWWWLEFPLDQVHTVFRSLFLATAVWLCLAHERLKIESKKLQIHKPQIQAKNKSTKSFQPYYSALTCFIMQSQYCCLSMPALQAFTHRHTCLSQLSQGMHGWRYVGAHVFIYWSLGLTWVHFSPPCSHSLSFSTLLLMWFLLLLMLL